MKLIFLRVGTVDLLMNVQKVCKTWKRICTEPALWQVVDLRSSVDIYDDLGYMARQAVDLSCGQLIQFSIDHFVSDDLLHYISQRSSQLKHLHLAHCCYITNGGVSKMVKRFQSWDKVRLYCAHISGISIKLTGSCCPRFKNFKLNNKGYRCPRNGFDKDALAIAENMPGRRHLQLFENRITSDGLLAILRNCPHLESLDIHQCFNACSAGPDLSVKLFEIRGGERSKTPI